MQGDGSATKGVHGTEVGTRGGCRAPGRRKPPQLRSLTPRTLPVRPEPTPWSRRHWCRLTEKYCTRIATPFQNSIFSLSLSRRRSALCFPSPLSFRAYTSSLSSALSCLSYSLFLSPFLFVAFFVFSSSSPYRHAYACSSLCLPFFLFIFLHTGPSKYSTTK